MINNEKFGYFRVLNEQKIEQNERKRQREREKSSYFFSSKITDYYIKFIFDHHLIIIIIIMLKHLITKNKFNWNIIFFLIFFSSNRINKRISINKELFFLQICFFIFNIKNIIVSNVVIMMEWMDLNLNWNWNKTSNIRERKREEKIEKQFDNDELFPKFTFIVGLYI